MFISLRSALLTCAALTASTIAPAKAGPASEPLLPAASATLPKLSVPQLLTTEAEPQLAEPLESDSAPAANTPSRDAPAAAQPAKMRLSGSLATMVANLRSSITGNHELDCLATGIYFESKSEPLSGQLAVGKVIANRANSGGRFPSSYCGVLFQRGQFSFIRGRSLPSVPRASAQWKTAVAVAKIVDEELHASPVGKALFFHARYVSPRWRLKRVAAIGNHIFYR
jgi:spore germination cell wall hydrolase CwlJ-like protein